MTLIRNPARMLFSTFVVVIQIACASEPPPPTSTPSPVPTNTPTPSPIPTNTPTASPVPTNTVPTETPIVSVGTDIDIELPEGDIERGRQQVLDRGCYGCHAHVHAPYFYPDGGTPGIGDRAEVRFLQDDYTGNATSAEQYLFESLVRPSAYIVEGFTPLMIPQTGGIMTAQNIADIVAYLLTLR